MKHIKMKYLIILSIILIIVLSLSFMFKVNNRNLAQKSELKTRLESLSQAIEDSEDRLTDAVSDTRNTSVSYLAIQSTLKIAVISAKKVYANPNHTLIEVTKSSDSLLKAFGMFDNSPVVSSGGTVPAITIPDTTNYRY